MHFSLKCFFRIYSEKNLSKPSQLIIFRNIFICVEELNYIDCMDVRREARCNYIENFLLHKFSWEFSEDF